ncbi:MAG: hypothetical protein K0Q51_426 [Rickettsiaceae bacterium]|jgi:hypothetical protein|nr:hypothetical protein [Rickettsiaceae bacterium]
MPKSDLPIFLERAYYKISAEPSFAFESLSDPYKRDTYINDNVLGSGDPYPNTPIDIVFNWLSLQDPYFASEILDKNPALLEKYIHSFDVSPSSSSFQEETIHNTFCAANNLTPKIDLPSKVEARLEGENYSNISNYFRWHLFKIQRVIHSGDQHDLILKIYKNYYIDSLKPADYRNNLRNIFTNLKNSESIALSEKITKEFDSLPCQIYFLSFDKHITSVVVSDSYIFEGNRGYGRGNNIPGINVYKKPEDWKVNGLETIDNKEKYLNIFEQLGQPIYQYEMSP